MSIGQVFQVNKDPLNGRWCAHAKTCVTYTDTWSYKLVEDFDLLDNIVTKSFSRKGIFSVVSPLHYFCIALPGALANTHHDGKMVSVLQEEIVRCTIKWISQVGSWVRPMSSNLVVCLGTRKSDAKIMEKEDETKYVLARKSFDSNTVRIAIPSNKLVRPRFGLPGTNYRPFGGDLLTWNAEMTWSWLGLNQCRKARVDPAEWGLYWFYDLQCVIDLGFSWWRSITIRTKTGTINCNNELQVFKMWVSRWKIKFKRLTSV